MYQRLLLLLTVLCIAGAVSAQNVMTPTDGDYVYNPSAASGSNTNPVPANLPVVVQKWVHDPTQIGGIGSFQTAFKSYRYGTTSFRLRFPKNYNPALKYPLVVFMHGAGEVSPAGNSRNAFYANRENQYQLLHGGSIFNDYINNDQWNGFLLFTQLLSSSPQWDVDSYDAINNILDTLKKYNGLDEDRVIAMGLSAGGVGCVKYASLHPKRVASVVTSNPRFIEGIIYPEYVNPLVQIPIWMAAGGTDNYPGPTQVMQFRDSMAMKGGDIYLTYHATQGHYSWYTQWATTDIYNRSMLLDYWNTAHKAQPLLYFQNGQFCSGQPISAKMGITEDYNAYEWQYDNGSGFTTIPGATSNTYTAVQAGQYRVRFQRDPSGPWSAWTPNPVVISVKSCSADTLFAEHFESSPIHDYTTISGGPNFQNSPYFINNFTCQNGVFVNGTEIFTQDASGRIGGRFMLNNTTPKFTQVINGQTITFCDYYTGDQVWRTVNNVAVTPNTDYSFSFYMGNQALSNTSSPANTVTQLLPKINGVALSPSGVQSTLVGDLSWKKYTYTWNSGSATSAELAITNNTATGTGNEFVLDEISLVKYTPPAMPAGVNTTLWSKAGTISGTDGSAVKIWANSDINGNNLQQPNVGDEPILKNNATDNINFNPVVTYSSAATTSNFVTGGFSGSAVHSSAHIYIVTKGSSTSSNQTLISETQNSGTLSLVTATSNRLTWNAGSGLTTANNANEANKTILWTLSKDNTNNTGDGNKQDIRKNGLLVAASSSTTTFTGSGNSFRIGGSSGTYNGNIAEVIYLLDATINAATQNKIESYLAVKYGTTLGYRANPVDYKASNGATIWPASTTYQADVFGIGTDSVSGLVQTISNSVNSGSGNGTGQLGRGNLVLSTNTPLGDKDFLMIGHDSAALTQSIIPAGGSLPIAVGATRINREWKVINTGGVGAVNLSFDTTGLGNQAGGAFVTNYALMIDNDGDGNFNNNTISFFNATSASGKKINFSGVTLNNNVVFTIITLKLSSALPAIWLGFTAEAVNGNALLNWKTSDEINVDRYVAEHSYNGVSFTTIGSVAANNNSGVNNYTLTDYNLSAGVHYYRIRRIDKDGKSEFSEIKTVKITTSGANVQVRPNPVVGSTLVLAVTVQQSSKTMVQVMSVDGKIMLQQKVNLTTGSNLVNLNVSNVPSGVYLVQVLLSDEIVTKKFIRQH